MKLKNILLISPRFYKGRHRLSLHPLAGLGYIAEALSRAGLNVETFDMNLKYGDKELKKKISDYRPNAVGVSIMTYGHKDVYAMIKTIKEAHPAIKIIAGGPHISMLREKVLEECPCIDYGIVLEGDVSIVRLCEGSELKKIEGLIYREGDKVVINDPADFISDLDSIPFPRYESFELSKYPTRQIGIVTSRGCPYDCIYCPVTSSIGKRFRQRNARNVVDEIGYWYERGYREMLIVDDNFTLSRGRVEEICELLCEKDLKGINLQCPNGIRADRVDYGLLKAMKRAGFTTIAFGVEAAENRVLKNIKKGEDIEIIEKGIRDGCDLGFDIDLFFLIGSPGETIKDVESSFKLAMRYPVRSANFYNIIPFPTTELFRWIEENGYFLHSREHVLDNASHYINEPSFFTPEMSADDRKLYFRKAAGVSKVIRRRHIERKIKGPELFRRFFSWFYTCRYIEGFLLTNRILVTLKEMIKKIKFP